MEEITIEFDEFVRESDLAYLLSWEDISEPIWFPKSECDIDLDNKKITMPNWLFAKKFPDEANL